MKLTFKTLQLHFTEKYPHGTLTKQNTNTYWICFDNRDNRSESEIELESHGISTDKRKTYTYKADNLTQLANKLKLDILDIAPEAYTMSKANQEWEAMLKDNTDYDFELFGE